MVDLQSFNIKSKIHNYEVSFCNFNKSVNELYNKGDIIIIDSMISNKFFNNNCDYCVIKIKANESNKEYKKISKYIDKIISFGFKRENKIIAIGGGVIQDISGYISSILYRGVDWIFYPTTLLSQGDSCIGGKTSINFGKYKNQIGGFYPPHKIIIDVNFLKTLPKKQITSGFGEIAHYFMINGGKDLEFFKNNYKNKKRIKDIIYRSLLIKKKIIEIDEFDKKERLIFNYGHSFGHALESMSNYKIPHGIAVANGMDIANYVSWKIGDSCVEVYKKENEFLKKLFGDKKIRKIILDFYKLNDYFLNEFIEVLKKDKKNTNTHLNLILFKESGNVFEKKVLPDENFKNILKEYMNNY